MVGNTLADCVFCRIVTGDAPATVVRRWPGAVAILPRHPVTPGHVLVIPTVHVEDAGVDPAVSALAMSAAAELAGSQRACNVITSRGADATQTVFHLHIHIVPRHADDGLPLPWSPLRREHTDLAEQVWALSTANAALQFALNREREIHADRLARALIDLDTVTRESTVREQEIIALTVERDRLEHRLSELDSEGGVA